MPLKRRTTISSLALTVAFATLTGTAVSAASPVERSTKTAAAHPAGPTITVWSEENKPDRLLATEKIIAGFTAATGIRVKLVGIAENQFSALVTTAAAAGTLPDVIGALPVSDADTLAQEKISDTSAASYVVDSLGRSSFSAKALQLATQDGQLVGVPSDSWAQLLVYRKDLFAKYNLPAPTTYSTIASDAAALKAHGYIGIVAATDANDSFTEQTFEYIALANGCQLVNSAGTVTLGSNACVQAFSFYKHLIASSSVAGNQTVHTTSEEYLAGKAGMVMWSSYILPLLAGQQQGSVPSCPQCKADPAYLATNSGIVTSISGGSHPATDYGQLVAWVISRYSHHIPAAEKFVKWMMDQGYASWLGLDPPGSLPVRSKTSSGAVAPAWAALPIALGGSKPVSDFYSAPTVSNLLAGPSTMTEWGLPEGQGALLGATLATEPIPAAVSGMINGGLTPRQADRQATQAVTAIQAGLG